MRTRRACRGTRQSQGKIPIVKQIFRPSAGNNCCAREVPFYTYRKVCIYGPKSRGSAAEAIPRAMLCNQVSAEVTQMLWTLFVILLIAWLLGLVGTYQIGAFVWLLLVAAVVVLILQLASGRRGPVV
jgi:hypothetical protein